MRSLPRLTDRHSLGSGLLVSPVCLGVVPSPKVVLEAFDAGINFFFVTADMHWPLYEPLRQGLAQLVKRVSRDDFVVCAAAYVTQPDFCTMPFEETLEAIAGLGRLDVVTMGGVYAVDFEARLPVFQQHRAHAFLGCRAIGASLHERRVARRVVEEELSDLAFIRMNPGHPGAAKDVLPFVRSRQRRRTRVYNFKSLDGFADAQTLDAAGLDPKSWRPHPTDFYRYALSHEGIDGVLASFSSATEIRQLSDALTQGPLEAKSMAYLTRVAKALRSTE